LLILAQSTVAENTQRDTMKKKTEIIIETDRLLIVSTLGRRKVNWCAPCGAHVEALTTDEAAILARVSARTVFGWVESGRVHYTETPEGLLLICPNSLS
jgi:hypothetical protein